MQESPAAPMVAFLREQRIRIVAGLLTAVLLAIGLFTGHSWGLVLALGPAIVGGLTATLQNGALNEWVEGRERQFRQVSAWADARPGKFARYFAGPAGGGSSWLWSRTQSVSDASVRAGLRLTVALYFWAVMIALLAAVAYVVIAILVLVMIIGLVGWLMSLGSDASATSSSSYGSRSNKRDDDDEFLSAAGRRGQRFYRKEGIFSESEAGRIDADGRIYEKTGMFSEDEVGRVDESGHVHEKTGLVSEEESHRVDGDGRIFKKTGMFSEEEVGRVSPDGRVYKKTGLFSEEEIGRIEDA